MCFLFILFLKKFLLEDIGTLQWKLSPPLEGEEEKEEVESNEMLAEIQSYVQRLEDLAIEVNYLTNLSLFLYLHL